MDGQVEIRENSNKLIKNKYVFIDSIISNILNCFSVILPIFITHFTFESCITQMTLSNTITLGSIFATFGSAIVSGIALTLNNKIDRILLNVNILFSDLMHQKKWIRWPFIKRYDEKILLDGNKTSTELKNPQIPFNVGSHIIYIDIPTVQEDFYDLPTFKNFYNMFKYKKQFKTFVVNNKDNINDINFPDVGEYLLAWDCIYDIWKNVVLFKISKILLKFGIYLIICSIIYSFGFISISKLF